jgi:hypothetical protein
VAVAAPSADERVTVEFVEDAVGIADETVARVRNELDRYLGDFHGPDRWAYVLHHCSTASNLYSDVYWEIRPPSGETRV